MNDHTEILKRRFWDSIKPPEFCQEKRVSKCSIYISPNNTLPSDKDMKGWTLIGKVDELPINYYKQSEYFEFDFEKANNFIEELLILSNYAVLIVCKNALAATKLHLFNNNNEFYLFNNKFYFRGFHLKEHENSNWSATPNINNSLFLMTYFVEPGA